ncbi:hypothetical protein NN561_012430 [Cricetulus griseus]
MGMRRFPQFSEREFLATIQNGEGGWGLSHGGRHSGSFFPTRLPPRAIVYRSPPLPSRPSRGINWDWLASSLGLGPVKRGRGIITSCCGQSFPVTARRAGERRLRGRAPVKAAEPSGSALGRDTETE